MEKKPVLERERLLLKKGVNVDHDDSTQTWERLRKCRVLRH